MHGVHGVPIGFFSIILYFGWGWFCSFFRFRLTAIPASGLYLRMVGQNVFFSLSSGEKKLTGMNSQTGPLGKSTAHWSSSIQFPTARMVNFQALFFPGRWFPGFPHLNISHLNGKTCQLFLVSCSSSTAKLKHSLQFAAPCRLYVAKSASSRSCLACGLVWCVLTRDCFALEEEMIPTVFIEERIHFQKMH